MALVDKLYRNQDNTQLRVREITGLLNVAKVIEVGASKIESVVVSNLHTSLNYVKFYDKSAPTLGTDVPRLVLPIALSDGTTPSVRTFHFRGGTKQMFQTAMSVIATVTLDSETSQATPVADKVDVYVTTEAD
jgi:hypothetical protein